VNFRLARGSGTPQASLRFARGSLPSAQGISCTPPDRGIKCPVTSRAPWSAGESPHADSLTPPGDPPPPHCAAMPPLCYLTGHCLRAVWRGRGHSQMLCNLLPSFPHAAPLERAWGHPREAYERRPSARPGGRSDAGLSEHVFSVTSSPVRPSPALWSHARRCGALFPHDVATPIPVQPKHSRQRDPQINVRTTTMCECRPDHP
jgi:hypothetical protein